MAEPRTPILEGTNAKPIPQVILRLAGLIFSLAALLLAGGKKK